MTQHSSRRWPFLLAGLIVLLPAAILGLIIALQFAALWIPEGKYARYEGFSFKVVGSECVKLVVDDPKHAEIYILVGDKAKLPRDISIEDLESIGFERAAANIYRNASGGVYSLSDFAPSGELQHLSLPADRTLTLPFAARADGPLLKLPVGYDEVVEQFGKPNDEEWIYWDGSWR